MDNHPLLQRSLQQPRMQSTAESALVTASVLLIVTWLGAWLFHFSQPLVVTTSLLIVIVALAMVGLRMARGDARDGATSTPPHASRTTTPVRHTTEGTLDARAGVISPMHGKRWSLEVFANIDAQRFAAVCETWFSWAGFDTRHESHRTQEGVDIWLHAPRLPGPVAIVRCKLARNKPVGLQELREFQSVVSTCKDAHGTFTTTSTYTPEALQFAQENGIELVDGHDLLRRILTRTRHSQQALLAVAYHGR